MGQSALLFFVQLYIIVMLEIPWGTVERGSQWGGKEPESKEITKGHMSYSFPAVLKYILSLTPVQIPSLHHLPCCLIQVLQLVNVWTAGKTCRPKSQVWTRDVKERPPMAGHVQVLQNTQTSEPSRDNLAMLACHYMAVGTLALIWRRSYSLDRAAKQSQSVLLRRMTPVPHSKANQQHTADLGERRIEDVPKQEDHVQFLLCQCRWHWHQRSHPSLVFLNSKSGVNEYESSVTESIPRSSGQKGKTVFHIFKLSISKSGLD